MRFTWTAVGDDGHEGRAEGHEVRTWRTLLTEASWDSAALVTAARPAEPGTPQSAEVRGRPRGTWYFGLRTVDAARNWSRLSNVVAVEVGGLEAPEQIGDLVAPVVGDRSVLLSWTAPPSPTGDAAVIYDLRYSGEPLSATNWSTATQAVGVPSPGSAGTQESFTVAGLEPATPYYFAVRSAVQRPNWSELSNVVTVTTGEILRLTTSPGDTGAQDPSWSPDGSRIVFSARVPPVFPSYRLRWVGAAGGVPEEISVSDVSGSSPAWSPDGTEIAFAGDRLVFEDGGAVSVRGVYVMPADPNGEAVLVASHENRPIQAVSWSPDGSELVFLISASFPPPTTEAYVVSRAGGEPRLLLGQLDDVAGRLDWSPDGREILYTGGGEVWAISRDDGTRRQLTDEGGGLPAWSPDGQRIAFGRGGDLWMMSATGDDQVQLTTDPEWESRATWSPDGRSIAFNRGLRPDESDIWVLRVP